MIDAAIRWEIDGAAGVLLVLGRYASVFDCASSTVTAGYPRLLSDVVKGLPADFAERIDSGVRIDSEVLLFKGTRVQRIDATSRATKGPPVPARDLFAGLPFDRVDAAIDWGDGKVHLFSGKDYARFSKGGSAFARIDDGYPVPIARGWPKLHFDRVDAAVDWGDGDTFYFFRGTEYVRYLKGADRVATGYPKPVKGNWTTSTIAVAHHGAQRDAPENTVESVLEAFTLGAEIVEVDVRFSKDNVAVLMHLESLLKTAGKNANVESLDAAELTALGVGSWNNMDDDDVQDRRDWVTNTKFKDVKLPTLKDAILAARGRGAIWIDPKIWYKADDTLALLRACDPTLAAYPAYIELDSTAPNELDGYLKAIGRAVPGAQIIWWLKGTLGPDHPSDQDVAMLKAAGVRGFDIDWVVNRTPESFQAVKRMKREGFLVFAFDVNLPDGDHEAEAIALGVDGVLTDDPAKLCLLGTGETGRQP